MAHFVPKEDEDNGKRIGRASDDPRGGHCQDEKNDVDVISSHQKQLFLFLMTIPVQLLFVFVLSHLLSAFLDHASHDLPSLRFMQNPGIAFPLTLTLSRQSLRLETEGRGNQRGDSLRNLLPLVGGGKGWA
jgi:hypothetical protein